MTAPYTHILDLAKEAEPPADGILSKTIYQDDQIKAVVFGFGQGQELSEHTASKPACCSSRVRRLSAWAMT